MSIIKMTHRKSFLQIFTQFEYAITSQKQTERCGEINSDIPFIPTSFFSISCNSSKQSWHIFY